MKTYKVWIEIEEYDDKRDEHRNAEELNWDLPLPMEFDGKGAKAKAIKHAEALGAIAETLHAQFS